MTLRWKDEQWRDSMRIRLDYTNCMESSVGTHFGIAERDLDYIAGLGSKAHESLMQKRESGELGFMQLPYQKSMIDDVRTLVESLHDQFESFVVVGIGGSALGNIALHTALNPPYYNELPDGKRNGLKLYVPDNVDPELIHGLLDLIDIKKTVFNVITKSGTTAETMANFLVFREAVKKVVGEENLSKHFVLTTDPVKGLLRKLAIDEGYRSLEVPQNVGGRFSVFSPVGLLSAAVTGIDIEEMLAGAAYMDKLCLNASTIFESPACMSAAIQYMLYQKGIFISVLMPYIQSLKDVADWFRQLWAESLGKKFDRNGTIVNLGPTPVNALGATDQHSQVQLYMEGPYDKVVTFITAEKYNANVKMAPAYMEETTVNYLADRSLNELITAEQQATEYALTTSNRPNCKLILPEVNAFTIGQLIYAFELQTAFAGELFNVNAFDQPGVEAGKIATYALMQRPGYEETKDKITQAVSNQERKIC